MSYYAIGKYYIAKTCVGGSAQFYRVTIGGNHTIGDRDIFRQEVGQITLQADSIIIT